MSDENNQDNSKENTEINTAVVTKRSNMFFVILFFLVMAGVVILIAYLGNARLNSSGEIKVELRNDGSGESGDKGNKEIVRDKELFNFSLTKSVFAKQLSTSDTLIPSLSDTKPSVDELQNLAAFKDLGIEMNENRLKALEESGFFLMENDFIKDQEWGNDDFADTYNNFGGNSNMYYREPHEALYISSDVALHLYHLLIDRSFQRIEERKFQPMLRDMSEALFVDSINNYNTAVTQDEKDTYRRLSVFYLIPLLVLDSANSVDIKLEPSDFKTFAMFKEAEQKANEIARQADFVFSLDEKKYGEIELDDDIYDLVKSELELIVAAKAVVSSPLFTPYRPYFQNDYTQFKPRSHYTKNNILKSYFIAMMWYGRMGFSLDSPDLTRDAIVITGQVNTLDVGEEKISEMYNTLSAAIEFFVGEIDDLTPFEYTDMLKKIYGENLDTEEFNDSVMLDQFIKTAVRELPKPRIVSEAVALYDDGGERDKLLKKLMQFRFMGQRFTPDAYILNNLVQGVGAPDPETGQNLPSMTTALMPLYVVSGKNETVKSYIDDWVVDNAPDSNLIIDKKLADLSQEFSLYSDSVWTQNVYWSWLNTYRSLLSPYSKGYPFFMTTDNWQKKNLGTVLGSYTELKHDTLLYAKQSYAEFGGGGDNPDELPAVPMGYVEADYTFWNNLVNLSEMTAAGLKKRNLMPAEFLYRYDLFNEYMNFYRDIVKKELANEKISEAEFEKIRKSGQIFKSLSSALPGEELTTKERRAGIIADIHTDAILSKVLYEATAKPYIIYVAVKDNNGARLTRGLVFKHHELIGSLDERYADEDWQSIVYDETGDLPVQDEWSADLLR